MGISIEELRKLEKDSYQILDIWDIRNHMENSGDCGCRCKISHGAD